MAELIFLIAMIGTFYGGFALNKEFENKYAEPAVDMFSTCLISLFLLFALTVGIDYEYTHSKWLYVWIAAALIMYELAMIIAWKTTKDVGADRKYTIIAMTAQAIMPLGVGLMLLFILAALFGKSSRRRKR